MTIPSYQSFMYPLLELLGDGSEHTLQEAYVYLADYFRLTSRDKGELLPSGKQLVYHNRIGWARTYLKKAGLIKSVKRATFVITDRGQQILNNPKITEIDQNYLMKYEEFVKFKTKRENENNNVNVLDSDSQHELTPQELLDQSYRIIQQQINDEILERVQGCTPEFFEKLVVELLVAMGYGGSIQDAGRAIGKSGDEGIDGIIKEDVLGLDMIYVQAKR
ncbi:hypothetical protein PMEGAS67_50280 [Priestia megaterium]